MNEEIKVRLIYKQMLFWIGNLYFLNQRFIMELKNNSLYSSSETIIVVCFYLYSSMHVVQASNNKI